MKNREMLYEMLKRYIEDAFELTEEHGKYYTNAIMDIFDKCPDIPEKDDSHIDKDKMFFEFQGTFKELVKALNDFRDDYRTAHGMNYEGGGGMFGGLFGRKK